MRRKTFDAIVTAGGLVLAIVLLVAGGLLMWGHNFTDNQVRTQLSAQKIFFPPAGSDAIKDPAIAPYLTKYAGQQLVTGEQAKAYADHFIAVHLQGIGGGQTYSQLSSQALANPNDAALAGKVATMFKGETLRGLLLNAYAFGTMGHIAYIGAVVSFALAAVMILLVALGIVHMRRVPTDAELHAPAWHPEHETA